jgi:hypothetical protein
MMRRQGTASLAAPQKSGRFTLVVDAVVQGPRAGRLAVVGVLEAGSISSLGAPVIISVDGRLPLSARLVGGPTFDVTPPLVGILLEGAAASDVPKGARITVTDEVPGPPLANRDGA